MIERISKQRTFWKVYAWLFFASCVLSPILDVVEPINNVSSIEAIIFNLISMPACVAIFAYAYQKRILKSYISYWKAYLFIFIASDVFSAIVYINSSVENPKEIWIIVILGTILSIISYIGVYLYSFKFVGTEEITRYSRDSQGKRTRPKMIIIISIILVVIMISSIILQTCR